MTEKQSKSKENKMGEVYCVECKHFVPDFYLVDNFSYDTYYCNIEEGKHLGQKMVHHEKKLPFTRRK